jgi:hypothetical protein
MRRALMATVLLTAALGACNRDHVPMGVSAPAAPENLDGYYYAGSVYLTWDLGAGWNGESFRVYGRRTTDADYTWVADVTSCAAGSCGYEDRNVVAGRTYEFYVSAVDNQSGVETATRNSVQVDVPTPDPPPVPTQVAVTALDHTNYIHWSAVSASASDFSLYRVYLAASDGTDYLIGETDSEGFLDRLAQNGTTLEYYVTAVNTQGYESAASQLAAGTPRPDYHGEYVYAYSDQPARSGFRFQSDEGTDPIVDGASASRQFRLEVDASGWWLVPGPGTAIYPVGFATTALKCGVGADATCSDVTEAPTSGYSTQSVSLDQQTSYVLRVVGDDGRTHYGVIRTDLLGYDQQNNALMIFDWAYQLQPGNPDLAPGG